MATSKKIGFGIWLGALTILWSLYPLLFSHARGVILLSLCTAVLAPLGWLTGLSLPVIWSGGLGLCNLTLALVLTSSPANLWTGLSAGLLLLALIDGSHRFSYIKRCWLDPGIVAALFRTFVVIGSLTLALGMVLGALFIPLAHQPLDAFATSLLTIAGACMFIGFLAVFLIYTNR